jgi:hypothetical protein
MFFFFSHILLLTKDMSCNSMAHLDVLGELPTFSNQPGSIHIYICLKIPNVSHICEIFGIFRKACSSQYSVFVNVNENWDDNSVLGFWQLAPLLVIELKSHQQKKCSFFTKMQILHSAIFNFSEISNCAFFSLFSPPSTK